MPSTFERDHRRELLILDTGPIRELVLFHAVDHYGFEALRRNLRCIFDRASYIRCTKFIATFHSKTTSAAVVAELNYWIRETERTGQERLWNRVHEEFREMRMDEKVVKLVEMDINLVARFGPMDVSLLEIARRNNNFHPLVLTLDSPLQRECELEGHRVKHLVELAQTG
ncbi:MAG: hypothetical protein ACLQVL_11330 [Terriglobia bacterium]